MYLNRIKKIRELRKMTVDDLAKAAGIPAATLYRWERTESGHIDFPAVYRLSKVLDCRMEDIVRIV